MRYSRYFPPEKRKPSKIAVSPTRARGRVMLFGAFPQVMIHPAPFSSQINFVHLPVVVPHAAKAPHCEFSSDNKCYVSQATIYKKASSSGVRLLSPSTSHIHKGQLILFTPIDLQSCSFRCCCQSSVKEGPGHWRSLSPPAMTKGSTEFHFLFPPWWSSKSKKKHERR